MCQFSPSAVKVCYSYSRPGRDAANCPMESLDLSANMLSMVETELMAQAVNKLRDVTLIDTNLSVNQVLRISHIF